MRTCRQCHGPSTYLICDACLQAELERFDQVKRSKDERKAAILKSQGGVCALCEQNPGIPMHRWHLDHDPRCCSAKRKTLCGQCDRGVLCPRCSMFIVPAADDPMIGRALEYVNKYRNT